VVTQSKQDVVPTGPAPATNRGSRPGGKAQTWYRVSMIAGICLVVLSLVAVGGVAVANKYFSSKITQEPLLPPEQIGQDISGPINILLLGMDERTGELDLIHADSIIIVHITAAHDHAYLVSMPRDSMVAVPAFPASKFPGTTQAKLTEAFAFGNRTFNDKGGAIGDDSAAGRARGVQLLASVLQNLTPGGGLKFNAVAIVSFDGFQKLVEAMGGLDNMCVDEKTLSEHYDATGHYISETYGDPKKAKTYPMGCYPMQPWEALDFVRQRKYLANGDGDYGRQRHQQQFLITVFKQLYSKKTLTDVKKISAIMDAAGKLLTVDLGGHQPLDWVFTLQNIKSDSLTMIKTNGGNFAPITVNGTAYEEVTPDTKQLLSAVRNDTVDQFLIAHPTWGSAAGTSVSPSTTASPTTSSSAKAHA
jgi:anionic cell wall polymer biosynthesis LytR-Cps2A-Psr (LCP) family protein